MKNILLTATALTALSVSAFAADLPVRTVAPYAPAPIFSWTGFYVGASAGLIRATGEATDNDAAWGAAGGKYSTTGTGGIFGLNAGYNYQMGAIVLGLETDIALSTVSSSSPVPYTTIYSITPASKIQSLGTVRARLGYSIDRALLYVTGGLAYADANVNEAITNGSTITTATSAGWRTGWALGAGLEYAIDSKWTVRTEGLYVDLGKHTASDQNNNNFGLKATAVLGRTGLNYKF